MPTLYLREYTSMANASFLGGPVSSGLQAPQEPCQVQQRLAIGPDSETSAPFSSATRFVRIAADVACLVDIGPAPDAAKRGSLVPQGVECFGVADGHRLSVMEAP